MSTRRQILFSVGLVAAAVVAVSAYSVAGGEPAQPADAMAGHDHAAMSQPQGEALQPVQLNAEAARRIGVTYAVATRQPFERTVTTTGSVTYDETRLVNVNPKVEGWVEQLFVNFTGAPVVKGQPLMALYSPMLVAAQEELILAKRLVEEAGSGGGERTVLNAQSLLESARRRLTYWDIPADEIARIENSGTPTKTVVLRAPAGGVVVEKMVVRGTRIMPGMDVYRIADLGTVWIEGDVFEKDLSLVRVGQSATVSLEAYPGEAFTGRITYVYPTVDVAARTGKVRVEIANRGMRLKPGMYARLELTVGGDRDALMIPRSAVHWTGTRSIVFVRHGETLMPHEVTTGLVAGDRIEVLAGISEGMEVVSSANFLIDAESNMGASMGAMPATPAPTGHEGH